MRVNAIVVAVVLATAGPAAAQDPLTGALHSVFGGYRPPPPPVGGDCAAIAAEIGPEAAWFGRFSGKRLALNDNFQPYATQGCFTSETDCRIWQQRALNYAFGRIEVMSCRPGVPRAYLR